LKTHSIRTSFNGVAELQRIAGAQDLCCRLIYYWPLRIVTELNKTNGPANWVRASEVRKMRPRLFSNEVEWRYFMIMNLISIRRTLNERAAMLAIAVIAFLLVGLWPSAPIVAAAGVFFGSLIRYLDDRRAQKALEKHFNADQAYE